MIFLSLMSVSLYCLAVLTRSWAGMVYQDFEPGNGTPPSAAISSDDFAETEYGWAFNGAFARLSQGTEPVRGGKKSWQVTIPSGAHVTSGSGIPSQTQTYDVDFAPGCFDRLTFWIWADSSVAGGHTVMIKFFDHGKYHDDGIGVWTDAKALDKQWSFMEIPFSRLPGDFDLRHVDKIEFFHYWAGTYYLDDFALRSSDFSESIEPCPDQRAATSMLSTLDGKENAQTLDFKKEQEFRRMRILDAQR